MTRRSKGTGKRKSKATTESTTENVSLLTVDDTTKKWALDHELAKLARSNPELRARIASARRV